MDIRFRRTSSSERFPKRTQRVALAGEIDVFAARALCRDLDAITGSAVIDLAAVSLLSAAGLAELARVAERAGYRNVTLTGASAHVRRVLDIVNFERFFVIE